MENSGTQQIDLPESAATEKFWLGVREHTYSPHTEDPLPEEGTGEADSRPHLVFLKP